MIEFESGWRKKPLEFAERWKQKALISLVERKL